jgi:hypothetical protein
VRIQQDPRYWLQLLRRAARTVSAADQDALSPAAPDVPTKVRKKKLKADWSMDMGSTSTRVGADNYPAKYSFSTGNPSTANCAGGAAPDFVVYNTGVAGASGQASIIAYDNLYSGLCSGTVPQTYWAYNTGGTIVTSVVLSLDGSQVAFIHTGSPASLVLLKWLASATATATSPVSLTAVANSAYRTCTAPCMTTISFGGTNNDTISSPFYDYIGDVIYVGDAGGNLRKFTNVFLSGTPAQAGSPWPVSVGSKNATSPVFDSSHGLIYLSNFSSNLAAVNASSGSVTFSTGIGKAANDVAEGPIVDSSTGEVYLFAEGANSNTSDSGVYQLPWNFNGSTTPVETLVGAGGSSSRVLFGGAFDNGFYTNGTGNLYVCGDSNSNPILYQIPITAGVMSSSASTGPTLASASTPCSPVSEVYNTVLAGGPYDWVYLGVNASGSAIGCASGGCVMGVTVTGWQKSTAYSLGQMVVDNHFNIEVVTTAGTSGTSQPTWPAAGSAGTTRTDGGVTWTSQGPFTFTAFQTSHAYALNAVIVDSNNNLQRVTTAGTSSSAPTWKTTFGATTTSGGATFTNQGPSGIVATAYTGGTSGIVVDNISTATGASNIYFSTLSSQPCVTSGGSGGCAVQASQVAP